jgi:hypothetical protein
MKLSMTLAAAATAVAASAGVASAADYSYFGLIDEEQNRGSRIELGTVRADAGGTLELRQFHRGVVGDVLGTVALKAGANTQVRVPVSDTNFNDVIALIVSPTGEVLATQEIEIK